MNNYYCPFCNPKYQFQKSTPSGELICGSCGEILLKKPIINITKIVSLLAVITLILPIIFTLIFLIKNQIYSPNKNYRQNITQTK